MTAILAATPYGRMDGSSRVRVHEWIDRLALPAEVLVSMPEGRPRSPSGCVAMGAELVRAATRAATVGDRTFWLHREVSPLSPGAVEALLLQRSATALFDLDDALFVEPTRSVRARFLRRRAKAELCARRSDVVIAGNEYIAEWASSLGASVAIVPSCVEPASYARKTDYQIGSTARIVWVGSGSTLPHLTGILPAIAEVRRTRDLELIVIGPPVAHAGTRSPGTALPSWVTRVPWSEALVRQELARMDVGVMPLPDQAYERGKCAYKLLQYGAAGLPVIGSPVGANAAILARMGAAAPVTKSEWVDALEGILAVGSRDREAQGARAAAVVSQDYSFARWTPRMRELLRATHAA